MRLSTLSLVLLQLVQVHTQSFWEAISPQPDLTSFASLLNSTAIGLTMNSLTNSTVLAPTNEAVESFLNSSGGASLANSPDVVQAISAYHILRGTYESSFDVEFAVTAMNALLTNVTAGQRVELRRSGDNLIYFSGLLQNSSTVDNVIRFSGGFIHKINRLLTIPQNISTTAIALNLTSAVGAAQELNYTNLLATSPDRTVFLPYNYAFQRVGGNIANLSTSELSDLLGYHIGNTLLYLTTPQNTTLETDQGNLTITAENDDVFVNNARIIRPNVLVANGVVHVIDRLLNPSNTTVTPDASTTNDAFPNAVSVSDEPFTSGVPTPTATIPTETSSNTAAASSSTASGGGGGGGSSTNVGAIAGGVVGGVVGLALLVLFIWLCRRGGYSIKISRNMHQNSPAAGRDIEKPSPGGTQPTPYKPVSEVRTPVQQSIAIKANDSSRPMKTESPIAADYRNTNQAAVRETNPVQNHSHPSPAAVPQAASTEHDRVMEARNDNYVPDAYYGFEPTPAQARRQ